MAHDILTPCTDSMSTECSTSPPEHAASDSSSSGIQSGEERDEVVIRPRPKAVPRLPPEVIQEEPFGRSTNMVMSSFIKDTSSATLPIHRVQSAEPFYDFANQMINTYMLINVDQPKNFHSVDETMLHIQK